MDRDSDFGSGHNNGSRPGTPMSAGSSADSDAPLSFAAPAATNGSGPHQRWRPPRLATFTTGGYGSSSSSATGTTDLGSASGYRPASPLVRDMAFVASPTTTTPYSSAGNSPTSPFFSAASSSQTSVSYSNSYQLGRSHSVEVLSSSAGAPRSRTTTLHRLGRPGTPGHSPAASSPLNGNGHNYYTPHSSSKPMYSPYHDPNYSKYAKPPRSPFRLLAGICAAILLVGSVIMWFTVDVEKTEETGRILEGKKPKYVLYRILGGFDSSVSLLPLVLWVG